MSNNTKQPYSVVIEKANCIVKAIEPYCERVEIAGSLRRKKKMIGDIEIVALPIRQKDLFGNPVKGTTALDDFFTEHDVQFVKNGELYKQFKYGGFMVDLFLPASIDHWGCVYMIRTGSHAFNMWVMTHRAKRVGIKFKQGRVYIGDGVASTRSERDVFRLLGLPFIEPEDRSHEKNWISASRRGRVI